MVISWIRKGIAALLLAGVLCGQAHAGSQVVLSDEELDGIHATGFDFLLNLTLEVFSNSATAPSVVFNNSQKVIPTSTTVSDVPSAVSTGGASISLSGSAQSNLSSLINVIGTASVINIGVNIVNITNSTNDVINSTNLNAAGQGTNFGFIFSLPPP